MKIHHLNCGALCPMGGFLMDGFSPTLGSSRLACHCLLLETDAHGLVLVDTGLGSKDIQAPKERLSPFFRKLCRPEIGMDDTALSQVEKLGFKASDVRHILLTHLDFDHAGGIDDFPDATIHLLAKEKKAALAGTGWIAQRRYRPEQFQHHSLWKAYEAKGEPWFFFQAVRQLEGLPPEILMIPLIGHTLGHAGIAISTAQGWLLLAGDAYFYHWEMDFQRPICTPGLRAYQRLMDSDHSWRVRNQNRLRELIRSHGEQVKVFSSHDYLEFKSFKEGELSLADNRRTAA